MLFPSFRLKCKLQTKFEDLLFVKRNFVIDCIFHLTIYFGRFVYSQKTRWFIYEINWCWLKYHHTVFFYFIDCCCGRWIEFFLIWPHYMAFRILCCQRSIIRNIKRYSMFGYSKSSIFSSVIKRPQKPYFSQNDIHEKKNI